MGMPGERLTEITFYLSIGCATTYATLFILILGQARVGSNRLLAFCCLSTSAWSMATVIWPQAVMNGIGGSVDTARMLSWYIYILDLYRRSDVAPIRHIRAFYAIAVGALFLGLATMVQGNGINQFSLFSAPVLLRLLLSVCELLLIENLYLNLPEHARWHVALPCILLGGVACLDILTAADAVLIHKPSSPVASARVVVMLVIAPLLILAAMRGERWNGPVKLSKSAVFHSATLVLSGLVLFTLGILGETLRYFDDELGWIAELSLLSTGLIALLIAFNSRSARSFFQRVVTYHFFADRFDYRLQWLRCIATLSGTGTTEQTTLPTRAIRAIADVVDSPSGSLFLLDTTAGVVTWAGSWNMPAGANVPIHEDSVSELIHEERVIELSGHNLAAFDRDEIGPSQTAWLAVPLLHVSGFIGMVVVGRPRTQFRLDQEVLDLLRILGREVATHIVERQAIDTLHQSRDLHDYGQRFAFVAHDIKNVSSQLAMLIQNADHHLSNPEFQLDMVQTVRSSVQKIDGLLKRLNQPAAQRVPASLIPVPRLEALVATYKRVRGVNVAFRHDGSTGEIAISPANFEMVVTHLLNNAVEAAPDQLVQLSIQHEAERIIIDVIDRGPGMSSIFIQHTLFTPLQSTKRDGSGIGAYQARELLREVGGQLIVMSEIGTGTTMRIILARADRLNSNFAEQPALSMVGGDLG